jgi:hypothetical protein
MDRLLSELHKLIGRHVRHEGCHCEVVEVLAEGPAIVLYKHTPSEIQANWFGEAQRRAPATYTLPLLSRVTKDLHPVVLALLEEDEAAHIRDLVGDLQPSAP